MRKLPGLFALALVLSVALAGAAQANGGSGVSETLWLDSYEAANDGAAGPVSTTKPLKDGRLYLVEVRGTLSGWDTDLWTASGGLSCGTPEPAPLFPTPGVDNGPVGADAEALFGAPSLSAVCTGGAELPAQTDNFRLDRGEGYAHPEPVIGSARRHQYFYLLRGDDSTAAFKFQYADAPTNDNYGQLKISVRDAGMLDCLLLGWSSFSDHGKPMFKNASACSGFFASPPRDWGRDWESTWRKHRR
jgi:hypothetical protein